MPHARGEKSSTWNGQAATNQMPNPSQYVLVSFHLINQAIRPLQPTPSGNLFSKIQDKTTPRGRVHFHHDTRLLKTCDLWQWQKSSPATKIERTVLWLILQWTYQIWHFLISDSWHVQEKDKKKVGVLVSKTKVRQWNIQFSCFSYKKEFC